MNSENMEELVSKTARDLLVLLVQENSNRYEASAAVGGPQNLSISNAVSKFEESLRNKVMKILELF